MTSQDQMIEQLLKRVVALEKNQRQDRLQSHLGKSSFVGAIDQRDNDGNVVSRTGEQHDGTNGSVILAGPVPALPTPPMLTVGPGLLSITWTGRLMAGGVEVPQPLDFQCVEIFVAMGRPPVVTDLIGAILSPAGGSKSIGLAAGDYQVATRTKSIPGRVSEFTSPIMITVPEVVDPAVIEDINNQLEDAQQWITDTGGDLTARLATAQDEIANLVNTVIPGLEDTATGALVAAELAKQIYTLSENAPTLADGTNKPIGAVWERLGEDNELIGRWEWRDGVWNSVSLAPTYIPDLSAAKITSGIIDVARLNAANVAAHVGDFITARVDRLVAGTGTIDVAVINKLYTEVVRSRKITTDMLLVGAGNNVAPDNLFTTPAAWNVPAYISATGGKYAGGSAVIPASATLLSVYMGNDPVYTIPVRAGEVYRVDAVLQSAIAIAAINRAGIYVRFRNVAGVWAAGTIVAQNTTTVAADTEHVVTGTVTVPAGMAYMSIGFVKQAAHNGIVRFTDYGVYLMTDASLIVDGAIDGKTITGAIFRTGPNVGPTAGGQGVILDSNGLRAFATSGVRTVNINSATGAAEFIGGFKTATTGRRVEIGPDPVLTNRGALLVYDNDNTLRGSVSISDTGHMFLNSTNLRLRGANSVGIEAGGTGGEISFSFFDYFLLGSYRRFNNIQGRWEVNMYGTWEPDIVRAYAWQVKTTSVTLVNVSTSTIVLNINLPSNAPAGRYNIDASMLSRSDAAVPTYVQIYVAGVGQPGFTDAADNPGGQDVARSVTQTIVHGGGSLTISLALQINGGSVAWNRSRPGTSLRVTYLGPT